jgi:tetratricopeptide (TPR) repeat protein
MGRYENAYPMYKNAIRLNKLHVGKRHTSLVQILVNFGIALVENSLFFEAIEQLEEAKNIMNSNKSLFLGQLVYTRALEYLQIAKNNS